MNLRMKSNEKLILDRHPYQVEGMDGKILSMPKYASNKLLLEANSKITPGEEKVQTKTQQDLRCLCLIVLVGLTGGRILALVIALLWCLLLKSSKTPL